MLSPASKDFQTYYTDLSAITDQGALHEQATRFAFSKLLDSAAKPRGWTVLLEHKLDGSLNRPDATLQDEFKIPRGYWEAKDTGDDLDAEIQKKIARKYPLTNIIFEDTRRAVLYQNGKVVLDANIREPAQLADLLGRFLSHTDEHIEEFHKAVAQFKEDIPNLAGGLQTLIDGARLGDPTFAAAFDAFHTLCKEALNPQIRADVIEEMLVQHLLTERLFRTVLGNSEFSKRNVIAGEIEKVIDALTSQAFSRQDFLKRLDYFYVAIEAEARTITTYVEKQGFLNTVYERFFQGFSRNQADTHGIVYTPQPIVDFMCESVEHVLKTEFNLSLSDKGVAILDPCTGTGNFLVNIVRRLSPQNLRHKYQHELFANEVMLLPYYIASLNIEHAYFEKMGHYLPFDGICFTDTLDLAEAAQTTLSIFNPENTERVQREKDAAITVIIGNPPYNVGQQNENDNNKNRKYPEVDSRIRATYAKDSKATNKNALNDAYVKFFRWATDRLGDRDGVICFVTNNSFADQIAFDGMRKHLLQDFTQIYHLDLHGNVRKNPKLSGTMHNVFGIQVGVGVTVAVRKAGAEKFLKYYRVPENWTRLSKTGFIESSRSLTGVPWNTLVPNIKNAWLTEGLQADYDDFMPIGSKETKTQQSLEVKSIFKNYGRGVATCRDEWVYDFNKDSLITKVQRFITNYNAEVERWKQHKDKKTPIDDFLTYDDTKYKWSEGLKSNLVRMNQADFHPQEILPAITRPFCKAWLYFDRTFVERVYQMPQILPTLAATQENMAISITAPGCTKSFHSLMTNCLPDLHLTGDTQCFPLYTYALDGKIRRDNITDWALSQFQAKYGPDVTKPDIFHYVYALLHHPEYRERYKENLKRELPRVPLVEDGPPAPILGSNMEGMGQEGAARQEGAASSAPTPSVPYGSPELGQGGNFRAFVSAGERLAALHVGYEAADEYKLGWKETDGVAFSWRVTKMRLSADKTALKVNAGLTLEGIPPEAFAYKLGNRSALEWVIDQYQVTTDKRSGIGSDPNRDDDPEYIVRLVGRVVSVSVETARIVAALPTLGFGKDFVAGNKQAVL